LQLNEVCFQSYLDFELEQSIDSNSQFFDLKNKKKNCDDIYRLI